MTDNRQIRYPVGIQTFSTIREKNYLYVDKTHYIYKLISEGQYYFLSRPRRFGKSLLLSTIEAYYQGRRDLFKGLALDSLTDDWEPHPVLHLDLNSEDYNGEDDLSRKLSSELGIWEQSFSVIAHPGNSLSSRFAAVIRKAYETTGKKVVILVDEYDKPMLQAINDVKLADRFRSMLKAFYGNLKSMDRYIEFAMLTGVARFSKVSIFSDLNNLRDISFQNDFAAICGITTPELDGSFAKGIRDLAEANGMTESETREKLKEWYDGYHFAEVLTDIYNPFSLVNVFAANQFGNYWFQSGTPSHLARALERKPMQLRRMSGFRIDMQTLSSAGIMTEDPITLLYQSGYLTISEVDAEYEELVLDYPNREVKESFLKFLVPYYTSLTEQDSSFAINSFAREIREGNAEGFMGRLSSLIAAVPYGGKGSTPESHFQNAVYLVFTLMGYRVGVEQRISSGRIDMTVETTDHVYIFEFKVDRSAREAMDQISQRGYWRPYEASGKQIVLIAANFDSQTRRLCNDTIIEYLQP